MQVSTSVKAAGAIFLLAAGWFAIHMLFAGEASAPDAADAREQAFTVVAETVAPQPWTDQVLVRGRTQALRKVAVKAEVPGKVAATPAREGAHVKTGEVLCEIAVDDRKARLDEAKAALAQARLDHSGAVTLAAKGYRSDTSVAGAKAALDLAQANVESAELNLAKTMVRAPFDGVFDQRDAEVGDFLEKGAPCGVVVQTAPYLVVGAVSETEVGKISVGDTGEARLVTGETLSGRVRFIATAADPATRTFRVELEIPNPDGTLKDGVSADFTIRADRREAHLAPRSALTLDDAGTIGVRTVDADGVVAFVPVRLLGETDKGAWIDGLKGSARIIVRGQDYVKSGQKVNVAAPGAG